MKISTTSISYLSRLSLKSCLRFPINMARTRPGTYVLYREAMSGEYLSPAIVYTDDLAPLHVQCGRPPSGFLTLVLLIPGPDGPFPLYVTPCPHTCLCTDEELAAGPQPGSFFLCLSSKDLALLCVLKKRHKLARWQTSGEALAMAWTIGDHKSTGMAGKCYQITPRSRESSPKKL